ncbi:hypothetical protein CDD83_1502 [Cordyceps sp. RAO-2017]|nr:hypothetical protein CDD83_1502 [Cordyceps sp. RAO-2017]
MPHTVRPAHAGLQRAVQRPAEDERPGRGRMIHGPRSYAEDGGAAEEEQIMAWPSPLGPGRRNSGSPSVKRLHQGVIGSVGEDEGKHRDVGRAYITHGVYVHASHGLPRTYHRYTHTSCLCVLDPSTRAPRRGCARMLEASRSLSLSLSPAAASPLGPSLLLTCTNSLPVSAAAPCSWFTDSTTASAHLGRPWPPAALWPGGQAAAGRQTMTASGRRQLGSAPRQ